VSGSKMALPLFIPRMEVRDHQGTILYDTSSGALEELNDRPTDLQPGQTVMVRSGFRAIWGGTLTLHGTCGYQLPAPGGSTAVPRSIALPPMTLAVAGKGSAPSPETSLDLAVAATLNLFDHCRPPSDGAAIAGTIEAPAGYRGGNVALDRSGIPALRARCRAVVRSYPGFATVDVVFASPVDAALPRGPDAGVTRGLAVPSRPGALQGRWTCLVTAEGVHEVSPVLWPTSVRPMSGPVTRGAPPACAQTKPLPRCAGLTFRVDHGKWVATRYRPTPFSSGITFFLSPRSDRQSDVILDEGDWLGKHWVLSVTSDGLVVRSGITYDDGSAAFTEFSEVPTSCAAIGPAANDFDPESNLGFATYGAVRHDVAKVVVVLKDGRTVDATIYRIPDSFGIAFDQYLAFGDGPIADLDTIKLYDQQGQEIHADKGCLNP